MSTNGTAIPGYFTCIGAPCDPVEPARQDATFTPCAGDKYCLAGFEDSTASCIDHTAQGVEGAACQRFSDCADGLGCYNGACAVQCRMDSECTAAHPICVFGNSRFGGSVQDEIELCRSTCDPSNPGLDDATFNPCPQGQYCQAADRVAFCVPPTGTAAEGGACEQDTDCMPGLGCHDDKCARKCRVDESQCPSEAPTCLDFGEDSGPVSIGTCGMGGCDPVHPEKDDDSFTPCSPMFACIPFYNGGGCVAASGSAPLGAQCAINTDCQSGACSQENGCTAWCRSSADCPSALPHCDFGAKLFHDGNDDMIGFCRL